MSSHSKLRVHAMSEKPTYEELLRRVQELEAAEDKGDKKGNISKIFNTDQDIAEGKRFEDSVNFLSDISRQTLSAIIATNKNFEINWANQAFEKLYGYPREEIYGKTPAFLNAELFAEDIQNDIYQTVSAGKDWKGEVLNKRKNGTTFPCEIEVTALVDESGEIFAYIGQMKDIAERKQAEETLIKARDELEKIVEERTQELKLTHERLLHSEKLASIGRLSSSIAHEFNNPLGGVLFVIQDIRLRGSLEKEDVELLDMAVGECHRMGDFIKSLQDFDRPLSGTVAPLDIHLLINSLLLLCENQYTNKNITITTNYSEDMVQIEAVADQINQVILNLLRNAFSACEGGGSITIDTEVISGKDITIKIQDSGKGIKSEHLDKIFDPFFTTKLPIKGRGLGLSVSYGIIKRHNGRIDVESEPGKGSSFKITLPIKGVKNA